MTQAGDIRAHKRHKARLALAKNKPCLDCGEAYPSCVMDFDHVRGVKRKNVGSLVNYSDEVFFAEVAKCDVVCSNCHRIRTYVRFHEQAR